VLRCVVCKVVWLAVRMSIVNTVRGKDGKAPPPQFWWEDGYNENQQLTATNISNRIEYDAEGEQFEITKFTTDLNHMDSVFFHHDNTIVSLRHQRSRSASIALYSCSSESGLIPHTIYDIGDNSGYIALSHDDKILAVGVLKDDLVMIFDVMNGDLLVNVTGGNKLGYWGSLQFMPGNNNNTLIEVRTTSMDKQGKVKETVVRTWDLGFKSETASDNDDDDDDEETVKVWEIKRRGQISCTRHETGTSTSPMICASELLQKLEWLDSSNGSILRQLSFSSWLSKPVISSDGLYVATAHFGHCLIHEILTGEIVGKIICPQNDSNYPLIPIQFVKQDTYLICRITQERALIISSWSGRDHQSSHQSVQSSPPAPAPPASAVSVYLHHVGGTISDKSIRISPDEKYLICWPYGVMELYDLEGMMNVLTKKLRRHKRIEFIKMRALLDQNRATLKNGDDGMAVDVSEISVRLEDVKLMKQEEEKGKGKMKSALKGKKQNSSAMTTAPAPAAVAPVVEVVNEHIAEERQVIGNVMTKLTKDLFNYLMLYV
jgi:hypothetical protein